MKSTKLHTTYSVICCFIALLTLNSNLSGSVLQTPFKLDVDKSSHSIDRFGFIKAYLKFNNAIVHDTKFTSSITVTVPAVNQVRKGKLELKLKPEIFENPTTEYITEGIFTSNTGETTKFKCKIIPEQLLSGTLEISFFTDDRDFLFKPNYEISKL